jgi:hypothetical protein
MMREREQILSRLSVERMTTGPIPPEQKAGGSVQLLSRLP